MSARTIKPLTLADLRLSDEEISCAIRDRHLRTTGAAIADAQIAKALGMLRDRADSNRYAALHTHAFGDMECWRQMASAYEAAIETFGLRWPLAPTGSTKPKRKTGRAA